MKRTLTALILLITASIITVPLFAAENNPPDSVSFDQQQVLKKYFDGPGNAVVGTVGEVKVTKNELMEALWNYAGPAVLNSLLSQKLIEHGLKKEGITVTKAEVDAKAKETAKSYGFSDINDLAKARKLSVVMLVNDLRMNMLLEKLGTKKATASNDEINQFVLARHILVKFQNSRAEPDEAKRKEAAKQRIDEIAEKLKAGADFAELAREYSEDSTKVNGGLLDWSTRGAWVKEFEDAVYALQPGQVSDPVESMFGYHIIKLDKTGRQATLAERKRIREIITGGKLQGIIQQWIQELNDNNKTNNLLMDNTPLTPPQSLPANERSYPDVPDLPPAPPTP